MASNDQVNEARKDAILGAITTATWQRTKERLNKHEKLFLNVIENEQTSNSKIRERFWEWLKRDRDERLTKQSVSAATVDEALDQWGVASISELDAIEARQQVIQEDYAEDVEQAYKELLIPSKLCARKTIMELTANLSAEPVGSFDDS